MYGVITDTALNANIKKFAINLEINGITLWLKKTLATKTLKHKIPLRGKFVVHPYLALLCRNSFIAVLIPRKCLPEKSFCYYFYMSIGCYTQKK